MKLINKTSLIYFLTTSVLFAAAGYILYDLLTKEIEEEIVEKLYINKQRIVNEIEAGNEVIQLPPVIIINKLEGHPPRKLISKDTVLFDPVEEETELFKELASTETINGVTYSIVLRQVILEPHDYYNNIAFSLGITLIPLLLAIFLISTIASRKIWKPFYINLDKLKNFSVKNSKPLIPEKSNTTEFKEFNEVILDLTEKIKADYLLLKEFTENASHEMQTPLSIINTQLEKTLQDNGLTQNSIANITNAISAVNRLSRLNKTLLLLAKIENDQFGEIKTIDLNSIISNILTDFDDFIIAKNIRVSLSLSNEMLINADPALLEILINNLISNAIKHNIEGGEILIETKANALEISNSGRPLKISSESIFDRFVKDDQSSQSLGLGLSLAKKICELYGWEITHNRRNERHIFKIKF